MWLLSFSEFPEGKIHYQMIAGNVSFVQEIRSESPENHEKPSVSCHCERSEAISWPTRDCFGGYRRLAMTGPRGE